MQKAIADRVFPAASVAVAHSGKLVALKPFGHFTYDPDDRATEQTSGASRLADFARRGNSPVHPTTLFDLASLTKVIATTPLAMILYERGLLDLDAPVAAVVPELADSTKDPRRKTITLRMLLSHSSGLPAYEKLFQKTKTRDELLHAAVTTPLTVNPGIRALYSDIGFIILSIALERLADESLDRFCQREIFSPLAMTNTTFNPPAEIRDQIPPTADQREDFAGESSCGADTPVRQMPRVQPIRSESLHSTPSTWRNKVIQGQVQDENAYILGGVAAHAGLFSSARDLLQVRAMHAERWQTHTPPRNHRTLHPLPIHARRQLASPRLGYSLQSLAIRKTFFAALLRSISATPELLCGSTPSVQLSITLLTNRTWPHCSNQAIKKVRPKFHDAIVEALQ